jgi:hypothetical protein
MAQSRDNEGHPERQDADRQLEGAEDAQQRVRAKRVPMKPPIAPAP